MEDLCKKWKYNLNLFADDYYIIIKKALTTHMIRAFCTTT